VRQGCRENSAAERDDKRGIPFHATELLNEDSPFPAKNRRGAISIFTPKTAAKRRQFWNGHP
jgi:hypothetical protein